MDNFSISSPICLHLTDVRIDEGKLTATILNTRQQIKVYSTDNAVNQDAYSRFDNLRKTAEPGVIDLYLQLIDEELSKGIVKFMYEEFWI